MHLERIRSCSQIETRRTPCTESEYDRARRFQTRRTPCTHSADGRARRLSPHRTPCTEMRTRLCSQIDAPAALLALRALTAVLADRGPAALLARRALTSRARRLMPRPLHRRRPCSQNEPPPHAVSAPLPVGTSAAHLASRPRLHPVLAWPLRGRGSLPLHALLRRILLLLFAFRSLHLSDAGAQPAEVGSPNRRHLPCEILRLFVFPMVVRGRFDVAGGGLVLIIVGLFLDDDWDPARQVWAPGGGHGARRYEL